MANKTGLKEDQEILHLFYQYSLNGLQDPIATDDDLKAKMQGDLREFIKAGVSTQTGLYLLECFGSAGYALSYIRSGQDRGDFSILRAWIPTIFQYDAKDLVSFLKDKLDTLDRLAYDHTAELPGAIKKCAEEFQPSDNDRTTRRLFSQIETEPRGSNAPYSWCWLKEKSIEKVISDYIPQSNFGQYRGVFFVDTQSTPQELSPDLVVIKEDDLKPVITIPTLSPRFAFEFEKFGIKPGDFNLSHLIIDSTTINLSDKGAEQFECWKGAEVEASWQFNSEGFAPIVKRAKIQSEQDLEQLTLIQARDVRRRFSREEFRIDNASNSDFTTYYQPVDNRFFNQEYSLVDFKNGSIPISFKAYSTKRFKPDPIDLKINIDHFLNPSTITAPVVEMRLSNICLDVEVCVPAKDYSLDAQVQDKLTKQLEGLRTDSFEINVTSSSIYPTSNTARVTSSTPQPRTSGNFSDNFPTSKEPKATPNDPLEPQFSDIDPSSVDNLEERSKEKKKGVMKWVNRVAYIYALLFVVSLVLVLTGTITLQWGAKSSEAKEEQATQVDSITATVDSLQNDLQSFKAELSSADFPVKASSDSIQQAKWQDKINSSKPLFSRLERQLSNLNRDLNNIKDGTKAPSALQTYSLSKSQESLRTLLDDLNGIQSSVNIKDSSRLTDNIQKILDSLNTLLEDLDQLSTESSVTPALKQADREEAGKTTPDWIKLSGLAALLLPIVFALFMSLRKKDRRTDSVAPPSSDKDSGKRSDKDAGKSSDKDASKRSNKDADKRSNKDASKRNNKDADKLSNKDAGKLSNKASNGSNTRQMKSTLQKQTK